MSHAISECYTFYTEKVRRARQPQACSARSEPIAPGALYCDVRAGWEGSIKAYKRCGRCQQLHEHLRELCERSGDYWPAERLDCRLDYVEEWGELPEEIAALAFMAPSDSSHLLASREVAS